MQDLAWRRRALLYSKAILIAVAAAFVIVLSTGSGPNTISGRIGADYPAFYAAGKIVSAGEHRNLYSAETQQRFQQPLLDNRSGLLPFAYPPFVALAYAPLAQLPYRLSYTLHTGLMIIALLAACRLVRQIYPTTFPGLYPLFFFALTYYPMFRAIFGGQNTSLSLLLIVLCWHRQVRAKPFEAGLYLGLLMFKPQLAVPLVGLFLLSGRWRVSLTATVVAMTLYAIGAAVSGPDWPLVWLQAAGRFASIDAAANAANAVSWLGFSEAVLGAGAPAALALGWGLAMITVLSISAIWWAGGREADFGAQLALASICILLIPPHLMFYEMGIALIALAVLLGPVGRTRPGIVAALWAAGLLQLFSPLAGFSLAFPVLAVTGLMSIARLGRPASAS